MRKYGLLALAVLLVGVSAVGQYTAVGSGGGGLTQVLADLRYLRLSGGTLTGPLLLTDGTDGAPSWGFASDADGTGTGAYRSAANEITFAVNGARRLRYSLTEIQVATGHQIGWNSAANISGAPDTALARARAAEVSLTNGSTGGAGLRFLAIAAPSAPSAGAVMYLDSADSDLKIKYADGTVVVIGNKP